MFESLFANLPEIMSSLFNAETILCIIFGCVGGMVIGALPGLSANMGMALMLPFTYKLSPVSAIAMLMTIYTSAICGGSISAILIHTPGTPSSAATALDGYPMTQQGRGLEALGTAMTSSMIGGLISAFALLFLAPPLAALSLKFGSLEYFFLACFGLSIIASLATGSVVKGLIAGCLGLIIGTIGIDSSTGFPRFTFGTTTLLSGVSTVPALIGLFSIPQVIDQLKGAREGKKTIDLGDKMHLGKRVLPPWSEFRKLIPTILTSGILGTFAGILPGAGGEVGSWMAYNTAKNRSKDKESFGKGNPKGVAASEAGNNAVTGGAVIPMMTLGIPGSSGAAILMGGLMIHGMQPGGDLFAGKAVTTYAIIFGFILANLFMGGIGLFLSRYIVQITKIPANILCPIIVVLAGVGSFAIANNINDVYIMFVFGVLGYFLRIAHFPPAAMVLGLLLGKMAEKGLRQALTLSRGNLFTYFLHRPVSIILFVMIVLFVFAPMVKDKISAKKKA